MSKWFFWTQSRNYGESQFIEQMEEEMRMSRGREVPAEKTAEEWRHDKLVKQDQIGEHMYEERYNFLRLNEDAYMTKEEWDLVFNSIKEAPVESIDRAFLREKGEIYYELNHGHISNELANIKLKSLQDKYMELGRDLPKSDTIELRGSYADVIVELSNTYTKKNADYGNSFEKTLDKRGLIPAIVRMEEKMERIENLWDTEETLVVDEDIIDSAMDLANYAIMTAMWLKKKQIKTDNAKYGGADFDGDTIKISDKEIGSFNFPIGQQFNSNDK